jgi:hypothetical protein
LLGLTTLDEAGCASRGMDATTGRADQQSAQIVSVRNDNWLDVAVYVVSGSTRFRLGTVNGISSATFRVAGQFGAAGPVQLLIDPIGATRGYLTEPISAMPGQRIELKVGSPLSMSTVAIWTR